MPILGPDGKPIRPVVTDKPAGSVIGTKFRTFDLVVKVTGFCEGELEDWPAHLQDQVYAAKERAQAKCLLPLKVVASGFTIIDAQEGKFEARVTVMEFPPEKPN